MKILVLKTGLRANKLQSRLSRWFRSIWALKQYPKLYLYWSSKLNHYVWKMKEKISSIKSQQISWRQIYHICAKHTILFRVFRNSCALYYWCKLCWSDPEGQKPLEDSSINSFQSCWDSLTYCIASSSEASVWIAICGFIF